MNINETRIRRLIRQKILEVVDVDNDGIPDAIDGDISIPTPAQAQPQIEDTEATAALKAELLSQAKLLEKGCRSGVGLNKDMTRKKARELADRLYEATEGGFLDLGLGTNEEEVQAIFSDPSIKCLADLSYIAWMYEKNYQGYTIASTLSGEYGYFSSTEFRKNVRDPLEDLLNDNPIFILGDTKFDAEKIAQMKRDAEQFISDSQEFVGRDGSERGLDALKGVGGVAAGATATYGAAGIAGAYTAPGVMLSLLGGSGGWGAATGLAGAALEGGVVATAGGSTLAAAGAGILASIPGPGWIALGVLAVGSALFMAFDEADFTAQEESMLSPDLYNGLNDTFKTASEVLRREAETAFIPMPPEETPADEITGDDDTTYPPLPSDINGLGTNSKDCIRRYQGVMNAYAGSRGLSFPNIKVDGVEGPETRGMWSKFVQHAFENHPTFSTLSIASVVISGQVSSWVDISSSLVSTYPGYTKTKCGLLAFSLDVYYGNTYFGTKQPGEVTVAPVAPIPVPDKERKSGGQGNKSKEDLNSREFNVSSSMKGAKDIIIGVDFNNETIDNEVPEANKSRFKQATKLKDVYPSFNTRLTQRLLDNMKEYDVLSGRGGRSVDTDTVYELQVDIKRNGKAKVKKAKESKTFGNRSGRNFGKLARTVEQVMNDEFSENDRIVFDKLRMQIRLNAGRYALSENVVIRKLVRQIIIKKLSKKV